MDTEQAKKRKGNSTGPTNPQEGNAQTEENGQVNR